MIGPTYVKRLAKLNIYTIEDLLYHFPTRYEDFTNLKKIRSAEIGQNQTIKAQLLSFKNEYTKSGKKIQKAIVTDETGTLEIIWFNQPFLARAFKIGEWYQFSGKVDWFGRKLSMVSPDHEVIKTAPSGGTKQVIHTGRLVPVYPETYGISSKWLRSRIYPLLESSLASIEDFLPPETIKQFQLAKLNYALQKIHFPDTLDQSDEARKRLAFEELFLIQLASLSRKIDWQRKVAAQTFPMDKVKVDNFINELPFTLTKAQQKCVNEILNDLGKKTPMNRLLEGDVGSGKTVVAAVAMYLVYINGLKSALMTPTEILAQQHYQTLTDLLSPLGVKIALVTGQKKPKGDKQNDTDLWIGTHALLFQKQFDEQRLALMVIDEQHRFGVEQRATLAQKAIAPHILTMTATPIPRTIALTLYGDLDLSLIDEMPPGRKQVKTWVVPPEKRKAAYEWIRQHVKGTDEQAFIICPLIEESETLTDVRAVTAEYKRLTAEVFTDLRLGLLHGRMKSKEKDEVINKFRVGELDILVSTPVIEVGIDIPQATIMMIEASDRFGLAQLHQLRGRVGRSDKESYCLLFADNMEGRSFERLKAMEKTNLGIELAELDFKMRGPGEIHGTTQHGFFNLKIASFSDLKLTEETRMAAQAVINNIEKLPILKEKLRTSEAKMVSPN